MLRFLKPIPGRCHISRLNPWQTHFVQHLPDLIQPEDYPGDPAGQRLRFRIRATEEGVELLGDAMRPETLEKLLEALEAEVIELYTKNFLVV